MVTGLIGKKVGMTQLFTPDGIVQPATVLKAGPCVVAQVKTVETDGYEAVQLGLVEAQPAKENKPTAGHFKKAGVPPTRVRREVQVKAGGERVKAGDQVDVVDLRRRRARRRDRHQPRQGLPGRRQAAPLRAAAARRHGSMFHRAPGSIGASSFPSRVVKGMRMARAHGCGPRDGAQPEGAAGGCRQQPAAGRGRGAGRAEQRRRDPQGGGRQGRQGGAGGAGRRRRARSSGSGSGSRDES